MPRSSPESLNHRQEQHQGCGAHPMIRLVDQADLSREKIKVLGLVQQLTHIHDCIKCRPFTCSSHPEQATILDMQEWHYRRHTKQRPCSQSTQGERYMGRALPPNAATCNAPTKGTWCQHQDRASMNNPPYDLDIAEPARTPRAAPARSANHRTKSSTRRQHTRPKGAHAVPQLAPLYPPSWKLRQQ